MAGDYGFTGSRNGPTDLSRAAFRAFILAAKPEVFRHGACRGWDGEAVRIVRELCPACYIVAYPGYGKYDRGRDERPDRDPAAIELSHEVKPELPHLVRNHHINRDCGAGFGALIGCPPTDDVIYWPDGKTPKGGTWHTIADAVDLKVRLVVIPPNGIVRTTMKFIPPVLRAG